METGDCYATCANDRGVEHSTCYATCADNVELVQMRGESQYNFYLLYNLRDGTQYNILYATCANDVQLVQ